MIGSLDVDIYILTNGKDNVIVELIVLKLGAKTDPNDNVSKLHVDKKEFVFIKVFDNDNMEEPGVPVAPVEPVYPVYPNNPIEPV